MNKIISLFLLVLTINLYSEEISPIERIRKIKIRLTSEDLTSFEYQRYLRYIDKECLEKATNTYNDSCIKISLGFFIDEFFKQPSYARTGKSFVDKIFRFKSRSFFERNRFKSKVLLNSEIAYNNLVAEIFSKNFSWDKIFTQNTYIVNKSSLDRFYNIPFDQSIESINYLRNFIDSKSLNEKSDAINIEIFDNTISAGVFTTARFNNRYHNTLRNKRRKKAAAILRIGLCDDLIPSFELDDHKKLEEISIATGELFVSMDAEKKHGEQKSCKSCHYYKGLDPLADTLMASEGSLKLEPSPGALIYTSELGKLMVKPVDGLGSYFRELIKTPKYKKCQVRNIWESYIASENALSKKLEGKLVQKYTELGGKINSFLKYLMINYGYYYKINENKNKVHKSKKKKSFNSTYLKARKILKSCNQCHFITPSFYDFPLQGPSFDGVTRNEEYYAEMLYKKLDLANPNIGQNKTMPEPGANYVPSKEDLKIIKNWIDEGMPDIDGKRRI